jgi:hypothetical protein
MHNDQRLARDLIAPDCPQTGRTLHEPQTGPQQCPRLALDKLHSGAPDWPYIGWMQTDPMYAGPILATEWSSCRPQTCPS